MMLLLLLRNLVIQSNCKVLGLLNLTYNGFPLQQVNVLLVELFERFESKAQIPLSMAAVIIKKYRTSEHWDVPQPSEEPCNK